MLSQVPQISTTMMMKVFVLVVVALALVPTSIDAATMNPKSKWHENNVQKATIVAPKAASRYAAPGLAFYDSSELVGDDESGDDDDGYVNVEKEVKVRSGKKHAPRADAIKMDSLKWATATETAPQTQISAGPELDTSSAFPYKIAPHMADRPSVESFWVLFIMAALTLLLAAGFICTTILCIKYGRSWKKKLHSIYLTIVKRFQRRVTRADREDAESLQEITQSVRYINFRNEEHDEEQAEENLFSSFGEK